MKIKNLFIFLLFVIQINTLISKDLNLDKIPKLLGSSNAGNEFYLTFHPGWITKADSTGIFIYVASPFYTDVNLEISSKGIKKTLQTKPFKTSAFFLTKNEVLMYYNFLEQKDPEKVFENSAIKITSKDPIICYGIYRYEFTTDGYLALPVNSWGMNYQIASYDDIAAAPYSRYSQPSFCSIVAAYDGTVVNFRLGKDSTCNVYGSSDTIYHGNTITKILNSGDVWLIPGMGKLNDLTGSIVTSNLPVGVFSGNFCTYIPNYCGSCDYIIEQEVPEETWGKEYFVPHIKDRQKASIVKVFAAQHPADIYFDNVKVATLTEKGGAEGSGFIEMRTNNENINRPVIISSDKKINVVLFNPGQQDDNIESDPFQMNIFSEKNLQKEVFFSTLGISNERAIRFNFIILVYKSDSTGKIPDNIQFGKHNGDEIIWQNLNQFQPEPGIPFKFEIPGEDQLYHFSKAILISEPGIYSIKSDTKFAAYNYGRSSYESFGYQLAGFYSNSGSSDNIKPLIDSDIHKNGTFLATINDVGVANQIINDDGEIQNLEDDISRLGYVNIISNLSNNYVFEVNDFIPGVDKTCSFKLTKIDSTKDAQAVLVISDRKGNDSILIISHNIAKEGFPEPISTITSFGLLKPYQKSSIRLAFTNFSDISTRNIQSVLLKNQDEHFFIKSHIDDGFKIKPSDTMFVEIEYQAGDIEGNFSNILCLQIDDEIYEYYTLIAEVSNPLIKCDDLTFVINENDNKTTLGDIKIENDGKFPLEINNVISSNPDIFKLKLKNISSDNPLIINPKSYRNVKLEFQTKEPGIYYDTIQFMSNGKILKNKSFIKGYYFLSDIDNEIVNDLFYITSTNESIEISNKKYNGKVTIKLIDVLGNILANHIDIDNFQNLSIPLKNLISGTYLLIIECNNRTLHKKYNFVK